MRHLVDLVPLPEQGRHLTNAPTLGAGLARVRARTVSGPGGWPPPDSGGLGDESRTKGLGSRLPRKGRRALPRCPASTRLAATLEMPVG